MYALLLINWIKISIEGAVFSAGKIYTAAVLGVFNLNYQVPIQRAEFPLAWYLTKLTLPRTGSIDLGLLIL